MSDEQVNKIEEVDEIEEADPGENPYGADEVAQDEEGDA